MPLDAVIYDMDGTLCDVSTVRHYVSGPTKDFHRFHLAATTSCPPHDWVVEAAQADNAAGRAVLIVSARMANWAYATLHWADNVGIPYVDAWFRAEGDYRPDHEVKREIYADIVARGYNVVKAYDDNPSIVRLWAELGVECVVVPGWDGVPSGVYNYNE